MKAPAASSPPFAVPRKSVLAMKGKNGPEVCTQVSLSADDAGRSHAGRITHDVLVLRDILRPIQRSRSAELTSNARRVGAEDLEQREAALDHVVAAQPLVVRDGEGAILAVDLGHGEELMALAHLRFVLAGGTVAT